MSLLQLCVAVGDQFFVELAVSLRTLPVPDQVAKNRSDEKQGNDQRQHSLNLVRVCDPAKAGADNEAFAGSLVHAADRRGRDHRGIQRLTSIPGTREHPGRWRTTTRIPP